MAKMPCIYKGVNYARDNLPFGTDNFKQYLRTSQDFGLGRFFACILDEDNGIIY